MFKVISINPLLFKYYNNLSLEKTEFSAHKKIETKPLLYKKKMLLPYEMNG